MKKSFLFLLGFVFIFSGIFIAYGAYDLKGLYNYDPEIHSGLTTTDQTIPSYYGSGSAVKAVQFTALLNTVRTMGYYCRTQTPVGTLLFGGFDSEGNVMCKNFVSVPSDCGDDKIPVNTSKGWVCKDYVEIPKNCDAAGRILQWSGTAWTCGAKFPLPTDCTDGQTIKWNATNTSWICATVSGGGDGGNVYWTQIDTGLIGYSNAINIGNLPSGSLESVGTIQYTGSGNFMGRDNESWKKFENEGVCPSGQIMIGFTKDGDPLCKTCDGCGCTGTDGITGLCLTSDGTLTGNPSAWVNGSQISWSNFVWMSPAPKFVKKSGDPDTKDSVHRMGASDTRDCKFECNTINGYYWDGDSCESVGSDTCITPFTNDSCFGSCGTLPANSMWVEFGGLSGKYPKLTPPLSPTPTAEYRSDFTSSWYCQYKCSSGYTWNGSVCVVGGGGIGNVCSGQPTETDSNGVVRSYVDDANGHRYYTVQVGTQCWTGENLRTNNGSIGISTCYAGGNACYNTPPYNTVDKNGRLYNWKAAMQGKVKPGVKGICPTGWHLPTDAEWYTLENYLKTVSSCDSGREDWGCATAGSRMKVGGNSGFESLMSGFSEMSSTTFSGQGDNTFYWTSTQAPTLLLPSTNTVFRGLKAEDDGVLRGFQDSNYLFSVRCVLGNGTDITTDEDQPNNPSGLGCNPTTKPGGVTTQSPSSVAKPCTLYSNDPGPGNWSLAGEHPDSCCPFCCKQDADAFDVTDADGQAKKAAQDYAAKLGTILKGLIETRLGYLFQEYGDEWGDASSGGWGVDFSDNWDTQWGKLTDAQLAFFRPLDSGCDTCPPDSLDDLAKCAAGLSWDWTQMCCASSSGVCGAKGEGEDLLKTIFGDGSKGFFDGIIGNSLPAGMKNLIEDNSDYFPMAYYETLGGALSEDLDGVPNDNPNFVTTGNWWTDYPVKFISGRHRIGRSDVPQGVKWKGWKGSGSDFPCDGFKGDKKYTSTNGGTCASCAAPLPSTTESMDTKVGTPINVDTQWQSEDSTKPCYVGCKKRYVDANGNELFFQDGTPALDTGYNSPVKLYDSNGQEVVPPWIMEERFWDAVNKKCAKASCSSPEPTTPFVVVNRFNPPPLKAANKGWTFMPSAVFCDNYNVPCCYTCGSGYTYDSTTKKCVADCPSNPPRATSSDINAGVAAGAVPTGAEMIKNIPCTPTSNPPVWTKISDMTSPWVGKAALDCCLWRCPQGKNLVHYDMGTTTYNDVLTGASVTKTLYEWICE